MPTLQQQIDTLQEQIDYQKDIAAHTDGQAWHQETEKVRGMKQQLTVLKQRLQAAKTERKTDLAKIHVAKKDLALTDDTYRAILRQVAQVDSAADLTTTQRAAVLAHFKRVGWKPKRSRKLSPPRDGLAGKILALWIQMHKDGLLKDGSEQALGRYCLRMGGKQRPDWLTHKEARTVIESLKQWRKRLGENA